MSEFEFCSKEHIAEYVKQSKEELHEQIKDCVRKGHTRPRLLIIQVGNNPASNKYVAGKIADANEVCIETSLMKFPETITYEELTDFLLKERDNFHGIIVQLPLPEHLQKELDNIQCYIRPDQDVDGFRVDSFHKACTPEGIVRYLKYSKGSDWFVGKHAVIIGRSELVGRPLAKMLLDKDCTVTVCHSKTKHLKSVCKNADIIISAVGKANMVDKNFIKNSKTTVINVGFDFIYGNMVGDIDVNSVKEITQWCTPIIGSSGLWTRLSLMQNTFDAYVMQEEIDV